MTKTPTLSLFIFSKCLNTENSMKKVPIIWGECCSEKMQVDLVHSELICQKLKRCERIFGAYFANNVPRLQPQKGLVEKKLQGFFGKNLILLTNYG